MKTVAYKLSSHSTARYSSLDGNAYDSVDDAVEALNEQSIEEECVSVECGEEWLVYESQADADEDDDGRASHKAIGRIERVMVERDDRPFAIDDGHGTQLCSGLSEHEVESVAQAHADRLGESVYYYRTPAREDAIEGSPDDDSVEVTPGEITSGEIKINIYRQGGDWYGARWIDGEYDGCDELDVAADATEADARAHAMTMPLRVAGERTVVRTDDVA